MNFVYIICLIHGYHGGTRIREVDEEILSDFLDVSKPTGSPRYKIVEQYRR